MRLQFFCLLFSSLFFSASRVPAQVVLSEIMFDPLGDDTHDEFIEIVNLSESISVNLSNWQISDGAGFDTIIEFNDGIVLNPKQFGIILDPSYFENSNTYDNLIPESSLILTIDNSTFGSRGLSNSTPETVSLIKNTGEIASQYTYSLGNDMGYSDEKIDLAGANSPENWANSQNLFGTPGGPNSVSPLNYDLAIFSDDILFVPSKIQAEESVTIRAIIRNLGYLPATNFHVTFFEDTDRDSLAEMGEELSLAFEFEGTLLQGDSTSFAMAYDNISPNHHLIMVKINFTLDENTTNNLALKELLVGYRERTMIINEIMYSPLPEQTEWIEILNLYSQPINLAQWRLSDADTNRKSFIAKNMLLQPHHFFVLAGDSSLLEIFNPPPGQFLVLKNWPTLNNDFDSVVFYDLTGNKIDRVNYNENWGGARGISLEKINPEFSSNDSSNWSSSVAFMGGTPGAQNSIFTQVLPATATLSIQPNPFSPDGDGVDDRTVISYELPINTAVVNVKIYDLRGRLIRFLTNNQPSGSHNIVIWDGKDNDMQIARMGIYVIFLQALNAQAGVLKTAKKTVVLAGKL